MFKRAFLAFSTVLIALCLAFSPALAVSIRQATIDMPNLDVYISEDEADLSSINTTDITASLDGKEISVASFGPSDEGIFYIYMLDVSRSVPSSHFAAAKAAVLDAHSRLRPQDKLAVITFGLDVTLVLKGGESLEQAKHTLAPLTANEGGTAFYKAVDSLINLLSENSDLRRAALIFSDGVDDSDGQITRTQLEEILRRNDVIVNALCIDSTKSQNIDGFKSFVGISGGQFALFNADTLSGILDDMLSKIENNYLLKLSSDSNIATGEQMELSVTLGELAAITMQVTPERSIADTEQPFVQGASFDREKNAVKILFSERINGADQLAAYSLSAEDGASVELERVEYFGEATQSIYALIYPKSSILSGNYLLSVSGIFDNSAEQNPIRPYSSRVFLSVSDSSIAIPTEPDNAEPAPETDSEGSPILIICLLAAIILILLVLVFFRRKKHPSPASPQEKGVTFVFMNDKDKK